jgi:hypothetical protein
MLSKPGGLTCFAESTLVPITFQGEDAEPQATVAAESVVSVVAQPTSAGGLCRDPAGTFYVVNVFKDPEMTDQIAYVPTDDGVSLRNVAARMANRLGLHWQHAQISRLCPKSTGNGAPNPEQLLARPLSSFVRDPGALPRCMDVQVHMYSGTVDRITLFMRLEKRKARRGLFATLVYLLEGITLSDRVGSPTLGDAVQDSDAGSEPDCSARKKYD